MQRRTAEQGTCVHLGNCDIGCDVNARNTLDLNYLAVRRAARRRCSSPPPRHVIEPIDGGYRVGSTGSRRPPRPRHETARMVVLAAGSLGSTELLLRCRDVHETLPGLSPPAGRLEQQRRLPDARLHYADRASTPRSVRPSPPPSTSSTAQPAGSRSHRGRRLPGPRGTWPTGAATCARSVASGSPSLRVMASLGESLEFSRVMPWFAQGRDAADGTSGLRRRLASRRPATRVGPLGRRRVATDDRGDRRHARPAGRGDRWHPDRAAHLVAPGLLRHAASAGGLQHGHRSGHERRRPPRAGLGPAQPLRRRRRHRPRGTRGDPSRTIATLAERIATIIVAEGR